MPRVSRTGYCSTRFSTSPSRVSSACWSTAATPAGRGKGVHAAVLAVQRGLRAYPCFVQVDIDGYFPSIRHEPLLDLLGRRFKGDAFLRLLARIVACGATSGAGVGLPIGALTSQHFANAFLDSACGRQRATVRGIVRGRDVGQCKEKAPRVVRGGSSNNEARRLRSAYRNQRHRDNCNDNQGFRFSLSSMEQKAWICRKPWTRRDILPARLAAAANCKAPGAPVGAPGGCRRR